MAFFLVIGMVAIGITELFAGNGNAQPSTSTDLSQSIEQEENSEELELRERLDEDSEDREAHAQLAVLLANTGRVDEAIRHYEQALQLEPDDTALRLSFARSLEQRGYDLDAEIQLERILDEDSDNVEALFLLAEIRERDSSPNLDEVRAMYERVIELDPDSFYAEMAEDRLNDADPDATVDQPDSDDSDEDS